MSFFTVLATTATFTLVVSPVYAMLPECRVALTKVSEEDLLGLEGFITALTSLANDNTSNFHRHLRYWLGSARG